MIARLFLVTPFTVTVPEGAPFRIPVYETQEFKIIFQPPKRSDEQRDKDKNRDVKIAGKPTFEADIVHIDFIKDNFNRLIESPSDPSGDLIQEMLNSYLLRLRHVTKSSVVRPVRIQECTYRLSYLNDDGSELPHQTGYFRHRLSKSVSMSWIALTSAIWDDVHALPANYSPPPWEGLLLDAAYPGVSVGNSIVLAATGLEVFIARILDLLKEDSTTPSELWNWINNRPDRTREPSVEEQFDTLLKIFCGHSLKEDQELWVMFKNLKSARNAFVHTGVARIGKNEEPLSKDKAMPLVVAASKIIERIRGWIPAKHHWKQHLHQVEVQAAIPLLKPQSNSGG